MSTQKSLSRNATVILEYISKYGPLTQKTMLREMDMTARALRYSLDKLERNGMIRKFPNFDDVRSPHYDVEI